ncbi:MAG: hypothetical protein KGZ30_04695, partial [Anaplasmataceae bacterium]|nr:hypothetical protein [Anaplasmataceae bacterium]
IAQAQAFGEALGKANLNVWGDPSTVAKMTTAFNSGQQTGHYVEGLLHGTPDEAKALVGQLGTAGTALLKRLTGIDLLAATESGNSASQPS